MKSWYRRSSIAAESRESVEKGRTDPKGWSLSDPVVDLSPTVRLRLRDLCDGIGIFGGNGSGKSSTSARLIFESLLSRGAGALFLTVKDSDPADYVALAHSVGRGRDVIRVTPGGAHRINVVEVAANQGGTENVVKMLSVAMSIVEGARAASGSTDPIWDRARDALTRNLCDLLLAAGLPLTLENMARVLDSAPTDTAELHALFAADDRGEHVTGPGGQVSDFWRCYLQASANYRRGVPGIDPNSARATVRYWTEEYPKLPERTRGSVRFGFDAMVGALTRGEIADLCTTETTLPLSVLRDGKIVILDLPVRRDGEAARIAQAIIKFLVQNELEREAIDAASNVRPVLIGIDEAQEFLSSADVAFQATARGARACTVLITQSVAGMRAKLGRDGAEQILGVLGTKIVHACDGETASWIADLIGQDWSFSPTVSDRGGVSLSQGKRHLVEPIALSRLARGGPEFGHCAEAYIFKPGARWGRRKRNFACVALQQKGQNGHVVC